MILVFSTCTKKLSYQFFYLDIENPLGRGTLAKFEPSMNIGYTVSPGIVAGGLPNLVILSTYKCSTYLNLNPAEIRVF